MEEEREEGSVGRGLQDPPPGSRETPQPAARLPALDTAPAHPGEPAAVRGAPGEPGAPSASRPSGANPGPALTVPPAARAPVLSRPAAAPCPSSRSAPPPPRAPTDERQPRRDAFKYRARPRRERRPPPAPRPGKLGRVGGLPRGPRGSTPFLAPAEGAPRGRRSAGRRVPRGRRSSGLQTQSLRLRKPGSPQPTKGPAAPRGMELLVGATPSCPVGGGHCAPPRTWSVNFQITRCRSLEMDSPWPPVQMSP